MSTVDATHDLSRAVTAEELKQKLGSFGQLLAPGKIVKGSASYIVKEQGEKKDKNDAITDRIRGLYALDDDELGHTTTGHSCVTSLDYDLAHKTGSDLLYGEILPSGVSKLLDSRHLDAAGATSVYDLGMGLGKLALQAYLEFPNLEKVVGVELSVARTARGMAALARMAESESERFSVLTDENCTAVRLTEEEQIIETTTKPVSLKYKRMAVQVEEKRPGRERVLEFRHQNLFETVDALDADIIICETHFPDDSLPKLCDFLNRMKTGARLLTYENLDSVYQRLHRDIPFQRLEVNTVDDKVFTSWATNRGHRFHLWRKLKSGTSVTSSRNSGNGNVNGSSHSSGHGKACMKSANKD